MHTCMHMQRSPYTHMHEQVLHFSTFRMRLSEEGASQYAARAFASFVQAELQHMPLFFGLSPDGLIEVSQV